MTEAGYRKANSTAQTIPKAIKIGFGFKPVGVLGVALLYRADVPLVFSDKQ